jgi:hypothetical protein
MPNVLSLGCGKFGYISYKTSLEMSKQVFFLLSTNELKVYSHKLSIFIF